MNPTAWMTPRSQEDKTKSLKKLHAGNDMPVLGASTLAESVSIINYIHNKKIDQQALTSSYYMLTNLRSE